LNRRMNAMIMGVSEVDAITITKVIAEYIETIGLDAKECYREHYNDADVIAMLKDIEENLIAEIEKGGDA
jgi:hypothetical protein